MARATNAVASGHERTHSRVLVVGDANVDTLLYLETGEGVGDTALGEAANRMEASTSTSTRTPSSVPTASAGFRQASLPIGGELPVKRRIRRLGGSAATTARVLSLLGVPATLIAAVGEGDDDGRWLAEGLAADGVDVSRLQRRREAGTGHIFILVTREGERTMLCQRGANAYLDVSEPELAAAVAEASWLHVSGYTLVEEKQRATALTAMRLAAAAGIPVSLDPGVAPVMSERGRKAILGALATGWVDVFLPNELEAEKLNVIAQLQPPANAPGLKTVVTKLGRRGCRIRLTADDEPPAGRTTTETTTEFVVPVPEVDFALPGGDGAVWHDSTGAGDAFASGFIAARLAGYDIAESALLANACGAMAVFGRLPRREQQG